MSGLLWWAEQDDMSFKREDDIFVFPSRGEPGSWMVGGPGFEPFRRRYFGSAEAAMQAVDAADATAPGQVAVKPTMTGPDEYRYTDDNPKTAYGDRKCPLYLVPPVAVISEAAVFKLGARKYGPYNWREKTVSTSVYTGAMLRHLYAFMDGEDADPESGESHLAHVRACAAILIDAQHTGKLNDNRHFVEHGAAEMLAEKEDK